MKAYQGLVAVFDGQELSRSTLSSQPEVFRWDVRVANSPIRFLRCEEIEFSHRQFYQVD